MATSSNPIVFYDIGHRPPVAETCCSPNPSKTRLALNFKGVPYTTSWVKMPDIGKVRSSLGVPACRKFADGSDFNTLPVIHDPATSSFVGDSFDIAVYLQRTYPDSGAGDLFPHQKLDYTFSDGQELLIPLSKTSEAEYADYARFNINIDAAFTTYTGLMAYGLPFDPETAEESKAEFVQRASAFGITSWEQFQMVGEVREKTKEAFKGTLGGIAKLFQRDMSGPFLLGQQVSYADMIVGGWLKMMRVTLPESEWEEARSWHGGIFRQLFDALQKYAEVK